jgi:hypothetical protein
MELNIKQIMFITRAINDGWTVKMSNGQYIFEKYHRNNRIYKSSKFLSWFMKGSCKRLK